MGRGDQAASSAILFGPPQPRRHRTPEPPVPERRAPLDIDGLLSNQGSFAALDDAELLAELYEEEIIRLICCPDVDPTLHRRIQQAIERSGWKVKMPAGTKIIRDLNPQREPGPLKRGLTVEIEGIGIYFAYRDHNGEVTPARLSWPGSGGYWRDAELTEDVELIRPQSEEG